MTTEDERKKSFDKCIKMEENQNDIDNLLYKSFKVPHQKESEPKESTQEILKRVFKPN